MLELGIDIWLEEMGGWGILCKGGRKMNLKWSCLSLICWDNKLIDLKLFTLFLSFRCECARTEVFGLIVLFEYLSEHREKRFNY